MISIIYCTDNHIEKSIQSFCLDRLRKQAKEAGAQLIIITQDPETKRSIQAYYQNLLVGIEQAKNEIIFVAEHDVLYPENYFSQEITADITYCKNVMYLLLDGYMPRKYNFAPLSTLAGNKNVIKQAIEAKQKSSKTNWAEPGIDDKDFSPVYREFSQPTIDIRHGKNYTKKNKMFVSEYEHHPYWGNAEDLWHQIHGDEVKKIAGTAVDIHPVLEKPQDLTDLIPSVSIIIPTRNENLLSSTIRDIGRTCGMAVEIIVVYDGWQFRPPLSPVVKEYTPWVTQQGVGQCRHYGICQAQGEYIVLLDAHMTFENGWLERLLAPVKADSKVLSCSKSAVLSSNPLVKPTKVHYGALIQFGNDTSMPFDPLWSEMTDNPYHVGDTIQCILGACYAFKKSRYFEIHEPFKNMIGWGSSEQTFSICNWFLGGECVLADCTTGHVYRTNAECQEQRYRPITSAGMYYNRLRLIDLLPISEEQKKALNQRVLKCPDIRRYEQDIKSWLQCRNDKELKEAMKQGRTFEEYVQRWWPQGVKFSGIPTAALPVQVQPAKQANKNIHRVMVEDRRRCA